MRAGILYCIYQLLLPGDTTSFHREHTTFLYLTDFRSHQTRSGDSRWSKTISLTLLLKYDACNLSFIQSKSKVTIKYERNLGRVRF